MVTRGVTYTSSVFLGLGTLELATYTMPQCAAGIVGRGPQRDRELVAPRRQDEGPAALIQTARRPHDQCTAVWQRVVSLAEQRQLLVEAPVVKDASHDEDVGRVSKKALRMGLELTVHPSVESSQFTRVSEGDGTQTSPCLPPLSRSTSSSVGVVLQGLECKLSLPQLPYSSSPCSPSMS
jgi:hypothetical protein